MKPTKKLKRLAEEYLYSYALHAMSDCSDSMHHMEKCEHTFNFMVDDKIDIHEFIKTYMPDSISKVKEQIEEDYGEPFEARVMDFFDDKAGE